MHLEEPHDDSSSSLGLETSDNRDAHAFIIWYEHEYIFRNMTILFDSAKCYDFRQRMIHFCVKGEGRVRLFLSYILETCKCVYSLER